MRLLSQSRSGAILLVLLALAAGAESQTIPLSRSPRPPRVLNTPPPPPPPAGPLAITTSTLFGGTVGQTYPEVPIATENGVPPLAFSISSGSLPPGLELNPTSGVVSGTPSTAGTFSFTVQVSDGSQLASKAYSMIISSSSAAYGNTGDPYATEGGAPNPSATVLNSCPGTSWLNSNKAYRLGQNLTAATPGTVCINLNTGTKLDLAGSTITGRVSLNAGGSGVSVFNGTINCNWVENGSDAGCLRINAEGAATAPMRLHHLTISNSAAPSRALHIGWNLSAAPASTTIRVFNITATVLTQPSVNRSFALSIIGNNQKVEFSDNDLTCNGDANACQAIMCYSVGDCKMHHNKVTLLQNTTAETARGLLVDGNTFGAELWNNLVIANNNRAIRVRDSANIRIHHNDIRNIAPNPSGAIHLADPDGALVNDLKLTVDNNSFELAGGTVVFMRNGFNATVRDNQFSCLGSCNLSKLAVARTPINGGNRSELTLENNLNVILFAAPAQVSVEANAKVNVCNTGQTSGAGTVNPTC